MESSGRGTEAAPQPHPGAVPGMRIRPINMKGKDGFKAWASQVLGACDAEGEQAVACDSAPAAQPFPPPGSQSHRAQPGSGTQTPSSPPVHPLRVFFTLVFNEFT